MDENELKEFERLRKIEQRAQAQYKRQNEYIKNAFDRVSVTLPKGTKNAITETGASINGFIVQAVLEKLERESNKN